MTGISKAAEARGYTVYNAYPWSRNCRPREKNDIVICGSLLNRVNQKLAYITGLNGCFAVARTARFLSRLDIIKPDILHFHNLHNSYLNLPMLFRYVKKRGVRVIWTLHDCWSMTGHCPFFTFAGCDRWKTGCGSCPQLPVYPAALIDRTRYMWNKKKKWFTGVPDLTIVTPSLWLSGLVRQSFLSCYPVKVINNGIDVGVFRPTASGFREEHGISPDDFMLLGVAFDWSVYKGLDVFAELAKRLPGKFRIVLVGIDEKAESALPKGVVCVRRTADRDELAGIYSAADLFVNPTREDNFPTVNIEALSCGTPVVTFDTNGSPEIIDETCGSVVPYGDTDAMEKEIRRLAEEKPYSRESCVRRAGLFRRDECFEKYAELYDEQGE